MLKPKANPQLDLLTGIIISLFSDIILSIKPYSIHYISDFFFSASINNLLILYIDGTSTI